MSWQRRTANLCWPIVYWCIHLYVVDSARPQHKDDGGWGWGEGDGDEDHRLLTITKMCALLQKSTNALQTVIRRSADLRMCGPQQSNVRGWGMKNVGILQMWNYYTNRSRLRRLAEEHLRRQRSLSRLSGFQIRTLIVRLYRGAT